MQAGEYKTTQTISNSGASAVITPPSSSSSDGSISLPNPTGSPYTLTVTDARGSVTTATVIQFVKADGTKTLEQIAQDIRSDERFSAQVAGMSDATIIALLQVGNPDLLREGKDAVPAQGVELAFQPEADNVSKRLELALAGIADGLGDVAWHQIKAAIPVLMLIVGALAAASFAGPLAQGIVGTLLIEAGVVFTMYQLSAVIALLGGIISGSTGIGEARQKGKEAQPHVAGLMMALGGLALGKGVGAASTKIAEVKADVNTAVRAVEQWTADGQAAKAAEAHKAAAAANAQTQATVPATFRPEPPKQHVDPNAPNYAPAPQHTDPNAPGYVKPTYATISNPEKPFDPNDTGGSSIPGGQAAAEAAAALKGRIWRSIILLPWSG